MSKENKYLLIIDKHDKYWCNSFWRRSLVLRILCNVTNCNLCALYGTLKCYINSSSDNWLLNHPSTWIWNTAEYLGSAFPLSFSKRNVESSVRVTNILSVNVNISTVDNFLSSFVIDKDHTISAGGSTTQREQWWEVATDGSGDSKKNRQNAGSYSN